MATKNCKEYFVPQIVEFVEKQKQKAQEVKDNPILEQQYKFMEGMANMICSFVFSECAKNQELDNALAFEYKNAERCINYVVKKANELNNFKAQVLWIPDATVFAWITEYYMLDDKEEYEEEKRKEEEARIRAEEAAKKRAERSAKKAESDIKKAVKEAVTKETVSGFLSNVNPSAELLRQIGAEAYIGVNIINVDNVEARAEVEKLALKAISDKNNKLTLTGFCGKYKLSKDRIAEIETEIREKYATRSEPEDVEDEVDSEEYEEDFEASSQNRVADIAKEIREKYSKEDAEKYDELGFVS